MTTPPKPWETGLRNGEASFIADSNLVRGPPRMMSAAGPPLPPRNQSAALGRHPFTPGYGYGGYGGYGGGYGGMLGGYGGGYSSYGLRNMEFENRYVQLAEESAAPAFESIDNFVRGFSSVTMMLESTFQAFHMSFRAILGVAENMSRMKGAIIEFVSAFAILKTIYSFYRRVLHFLGLVNGTEVSWREAEVAVAGNAPRPPTRKNWPMLVFLAAIFGGPALVYRYLIPKEVTEEEAIEIIGTYDFNSGQPSELSFKKGDIMTTTKSALKKSWVRAKKGDATGLVPYNRIALYKKVPTKTNPATNEVSAVPNIPTGTVPRLPKNSVPTVQQCSRSQGNTPVRSMPSPAAHNATQHNQNVQASSGFNFDPKYELTKLNQVCETQKPWCNPNLIQNQPVTASSSSSESTPNSAQTTSNVSGNQPTRLSVQQFAPVVVNPASQNVPIHTSSAITSSVSNVNDAIATPNFIQPAVQNQPSFPSTSVFSPAVQKSTPQDQPAETSAVISSSGSIVDGAHTTSDVLPSTN